VKAKPTATNYWLPILGFIAFSAVVAGSVHPAGVVVVLAIAAAYYLFARRK
jgi:hypothetical protein